MNTVVLGSLLVAVGISLFRPRVGLYAVLALNVFFTDHFLIRIGLNDLVDIPFRIILAASVLVGAAFSCLSGRRRLPVPKAQDWVLYWLLAYMTLSYLLHLSEGGGHLVAIIYADCLLYATAQLLFTRLDQKRKALLAILAGAVIASAFALADSLSAVQDTLRPQLQRVEGISGANELGFVAALAFPIVFLQVQARKRAEAAGSGKLMLAKASLLGLLGIAVVASGSRGALLMLLAAMALMPMLVRRKIKMAFGTVTLIIALGGAISLSPLADRLSSFALRLGQTFSYVAEPGGPQDINLQVRIEALRSAMEVFADHPILGVGPGQFRAEFLGDIASENIIGEVLPDYGLIGAVLFGAFVACVFLNLARGRRRALALHDTQSERFAACLIVMFSQIFVFGMTNDIFYSFYIWIVAALAVDISRHQGTRNAWVYHANFRKGDWPGHPYGIAAAMKPDKAKIE